MKTVWFEGLKGDEKENFKGEVLQAQKVLDKLRKIVYNMRIERQRVNTTDYSSPSWAYLQAHQNGACEALSQVMLLLEIDKS